MIDLTTVLTGAVPTTIVLTLLLSENTPIAMAGLLLLVPLVLVIIFPIFLLSRPDASTKAKIFALGLALLPIWLGQGLSKELGWVAGLLVYLPIGSALVNMARTTPKDRGQGKS